MTQDCAKIKSKDFHFQNLFEKHENTFILIYEKKSSQFFLCKLKNDLKNKILNIDNVSHTRKKILTQIIMQKTTMKRARENDENHFNDDHFDKKSQHNIKSFESFENKIQSSSHKLNHFNHYSQFNQSYRENQFNQNYNLNARTNHKQFYKFKTKISINEIVCYECHRKKYIRKNCSKIYSVDVVIEKKSKNDQVSSTSHKRSKKNQ